MQRSRLRAGRLTSESIPERQSTPDYFDDVSRVFMLAGRGSSLAALLHDREVTSMVADHRHGIALLATPRFGGPDCAWHRRDRAALSRVQIAVRYRRPLAVSIV
jgi:hypothetical protein